MKILKFFLALLVPCSLVVGFLYLEIKNISCKSQNGNCSPEIEAKIKSHEGKRLVNINKSLRKYLISESGLQKGSIQYKFPSSLEVLIVEKEPKFSISNRELKKFSLIDKDGYVISQSESRFNPVLITDSLPETGKKVTNTDLFLLKILSDLDKSFRVSQGLKENDSLVIDLDAGLRVLFPQDGDREALVGALVLLYGKIREEGVNCGINSAMSFSSEECHNEFQKEISLVDLRYKNPVLK